MEPAQQGKKQKKLDDKVTPVEPVSRRLLTLSFDNLQAWYPALDDQLYNPDISFLNRCYIQSVRDVLYSSSAACKQNPDLFYHKSSEFLVNLEQQLRENDMVMNLESFYMLLGMVKQPNIIPPKAAAFTVLTSLFALYDSFARYGGIDKKAYSDEENNTQTAKTIAQRTFMKSFSDYETKEVKGKVRPSRIQLDNEY